MLKIVLYLIFIHHQDRWWQAGRTKTCYSVKILTKLVINNSWYFRCAVLLFYSQSCCSSYQPWAVLSREDMVRGHSFKINFLCRSTFIINCQLPFFLNKFSALSTFFINQLHYKLSVSIFLCPSSSINFCSTYITTFETCLVHDGHWNCST